MGRRHDEQETRRNRTRQYPGGYDRPGDQRRGPPERTFFGPYYDGRGNRFHEDQYGSRYYDDDYPEPYYERDRDEREQGRSTGRTAIMWAGIVAVALIVVVGMVMATNDFTSSPSDSAPGAPQQPQAPQQEPVQPQQPQAPAVPQQDGASSEQVEGMRTDLERQLAEIRQSINQLRLEIWSFFTSNQQEQENSP